ncbi:MAG: hypothetical protein ACR2QV_08905 [Gammaproteobacteria bacterium]
MKNVNALVNAGRRITASRTLRTAAVLATIAILAPGGIAIAQEEKKGVNTGNDPRDFSSKFMPYYRYTELENGLTQHQLSIFGMWAITKNLALTYETPISMERDITGTDACAGLPDVDCTGSVPGGGYLPNGLPAEGDGVEVGMGDSIIRLFGDFEWNFLGGAFLPGVQMTVPTATKDVLGTETMSGGPIATFVWDFPLWPAPGSFFAMMNIWEFDWWKENGRDPVNRYLGRWFLQLPFNKKYKLYVMTEFQPIYDFETSDFSFWMAPEFGKAFAPSKGLFRNGGAIYIKPGIGVGNSANSGDRDWTLEVGFRAFFPAPADTYGKMAGQR